MKSKLFLLTAILLIAYAGRSQLGRITYGARAGLNFQNLNGKNAEGKRLDNQIKVGFNIGVNAEVPIAMDFYVQPGILISTKGAREKNSIGNEDAKFNLTYIEIPVYLLNKTDLGEGNLLMGFGPYIGFGIGGKGKWGNEEVDIKWASEAPPTSGFQPYFRRFDAGANLLFGFEMTNNLSAQINAQLGLARINPDITGVDESGTIKNTGFGFSIGYRF